MAELISKEKLLFGLPINIPNMGTIYQPKLRDFVNNDFNYAKFKGVFSIKKDMFLEDTNEDYDKIKDFDLIIYMNLIEDLIKSLKLLYKTDEIKIGELRSNDLSSIKILIKANEEVYCLDRENYAEFANRVLILLYSGNNVAEEEVKEELDEIELKMLKKRREFEKKKQKNKPKENDDNGVTIYDIANYIIHVDNKYNYDSVLDLTIYQLINSYYLYHQKENYNIFMDYKTSGQFKIEEKIEHWFTNK